MLTIKTKQQNAQQAKFSTSYQKHTIRSHFFGSKIQMYYKEEVY